MKKLILLLILIPLTVFTYCSKDEDSNNPQNITGSPYSENTTPDVQIFNLSVSKTDGGSVNSSGGSYNDGTSVTITATPYEGYEFSGWTGSNETSLEITITLDSNIELIANFQLIPQLEFKFDYNFDSSLDSFSFYKDSITSIISRLNKMMSIEPYVDGRDNQQINGLSIYSWLKGEIKPYLSIIGDTDQCICGVINQNLVMSLQIHNTDFNDSFKYALVAHEFFHVYQMYLSNGFKQDIFWLIEGQAATIESLYLKEFLNDSNYIRNFLNKDSISFDEGIQNIQNYESYDGFNSVFDLYGDITIFMNLSLAKILQDQGKTEKESFKIIFEDFWKSNPNRDNCKTKFSEIFNLELNEFYQKLNDYKNSPENLIPTISLSQIFSD